MSRRASKTKRTRGSEHAMARIKGSVKDSAFHANRLFMLTTLSDVVVVSADGHQEFFQSSSKHNPVPQTLRATGGSLFIGFDDDTVGQTKIAPEENFTLDAMVVSVPLGNVAEDMVVARNNCVFVVTLRPAKLLYMFEGGDVSSTPVFIARVSGKKLLAVSRFVLLFSLRENAVTVYTDEGSLVSSSDQVLPSYSAPQQRVSGGRIEAACNVPSRPSDFVCAFYNGYIAHKRITADGKLSTVALIDTAGDPSRLGALGVYGSSFICFAGTESTLIHTYDPETFQIGRAGRDVAHLTRVKDLGMLNSQLCSLGRDGTIQTHSIPWKEKPDEPPRQDPDTTFSQRKRSKLQSEAVHEGGHVGDRQPSENASTRELEERLEVIHRQYKAKEREVDKLRQQLNAAQASKEQEINDLHAENERLKHLLGKYLVDETLNKTVLTD